MQFTRDGRIILNHLDRYYSQSTGREKPVTRLEPIKKLHEKFKLAEHIEKGDLTGETLEVFLKDYLDNTTRLHHPGFLAHQVGVPHPTGALGSLIDGFTNNAMAIYEMGPAASSIEFFMINFLLKKIGWSPMPEDVTQRLGHRHGAGVLVHGGSLANMTALLAARNHLDNTIRQTGNPGDLAILAPESCHYSISKSAGIIGIGEDNVIGIETDSCGRIMVSKLENAFQAAAGMGKRIVALVANACSTGTGLYDPIDETGDFCREKNIWFHVDGAHGGAALFSQAQKNRLKGIHKADSMIIDAHKMLRTPTVCAALLVRDAFCLDHTFEHRASYLFHDKKQPGFDFIGQAIECTKAGLGLKFFMAFAAMGEKEVASYIDRSFELAGLAYEYIVSQPDFEVPCRPETNILCFRFDAPDDIQIKIRDELISMGSFHLSSTELNGKRFLRIVVMNPESCMADIKNLVELIRETGQRLSGAAM